VAVEITDRYGAVVCEIVVEPGLLSADSIAYRVIGDRSPGQIAMFAQPGSQPAAQQLAVDLGVEHPVSLRILPDRDAAKQLAVVEGAYLWLNQLELRRSDLIVAVGGGALTDVAGFIAATYLRGVDIVLVPTTLLGAVDAAIGGKSAVNVGGKNLAGAFRHPRSVLIDTDLLEQLPTHLIKEGAAEAFKTGMIADLDLVALYEDRGLEAPLHEVVTKSVRVKADIVNRDFMESDVRAWLNYGHTIGHAVEVAAGLSHGDAVAVGMVAAAAASERVLGFTEARRQLAVIERLGLPIAVDGVSAEDAIQLVALDKKQAADGLRMTLLESIASPTVIPVDDATVSLALAAVGIA